MTPPLDDGHECGWKQYAKALETKMAELTAKIQELEQRVASLAQRVKGKRSERRPRTKMPAPIKSASDPIETAKKRQQTATAWATNLEVDHVPIPVPEEQRQCPACGSGELRQVGEGKESVVFEYVQPHFRRRVYRRETLSCKCGGIVTAPAPERVGDKTRFAPSFVAHLIVSKCGDSIPQYRLEKAYRNLGIPMSRSTMCDLFHRAAKELTPLYNAALALVPKAADVHADETSIRQLASARRPA